MKLVTFLFATALAMCLVVGIALLIPEAPGEHGFVHPDYPSMQQAPPSAERHAAVLWLGWGFGVLQIIFYMGMMALGGNNGVDTDHALATADRIYTTVDLVERFSERVRDLVKRDQPDCFLVSDPLQWHAGYICA